MRSNRVIKIQINYALLLQPVLILLGSYDVYILVLLLLGLRVYIPPKRHNVSHSNFLCQMSKFSKLTWRFLYMTWKWSSIRGLGMSLNSSSLNSCPKYRFLKNSKFISAFFKLSFVIFANCKLKSIFSSDVDVHYISVNVYIRLSFCSGFHFERNIRTSKSRNLRSVSIYRIFGFWWWKSKRATRVMSAKATHCE